MEFPVAVLTAVGVSAENPLVPPAQATRPPPFEGCFRSVMSICPSAAPAPGEATVVVVLGTRVGRRTIATALEPAIPAGPGAPRPPAPLFGIQHCAIGPQFSARQLQLHLQLQRQLLTRGLDHDSSQPW